MKVKFSPRDEAMIIAHGLDLVVAEWQVQVLSTTPERARVRLQADVEAVKALAERIRKGGEGR